VALSLAVAGAPRGADVAQAKPCALPICDPGQDTVASVATSCGANGTKSNASNTDTSGSFDCSLPDGPASSTVSVQASDSDGDARTEERRGGKDARGAQGGATPSGAAGAS